MGFRETIWTLVVGGDIMLNAISPSAKVFEGVAKPFQDATIAYANLEIPLTDAKAPTTRKTATEVKNRTQFILKAQPRHVDFLSAVGFDAFSLANNHAMDFRASGLNQMLGLLEKKEIVGFGAGSNWEAARRCATLQVNDGPKVGFLSFLAFNGASALRKCWPATTDSPGIATLTITGVSDKQARKTIKGIVSKAKAGCEFLVVCLHWGTERQTQPTVNQVRMGRMFIDEGADVILGAHPHVLQPGELYKGKPIIYSLGNLISPRPAQTALYRLTFEGVQMSSAEILPAGISGGKVKIHEGRQWEAAVKVARAAQRPLAKNHKSTHAKPLLK